MAFVNFKKGLRSALPSAHAEGTFYVTTDERALYLDVTDELRIRLGDFQEFANLAALQANTNPSTTALYYVTDVNCLAKYTGSEYVQINLDTGATSFEVVGDGNAITDISYDAITRKLTLTKGATYATASYVGTIPDGYTETNIIAYINKKAEETLNSASGGSSESAASVMAALNTYKSENDPKVAALEEKVGNDTVSNQIDAKIDALKLAETYEPIGTGATEAGKVQTALNEYIESNNEAVSGKADKSTTLAGYGITDGMTKAEIEAAIEASEYDDTALAGRVSTVEGEVAAIKDDYLKAEDKDELLAADEALEGRLETIEGDYLKGADKEALEAADEAQVARIATLEGQITGLSGAMHFKGVVTSDPTAITEGYDNGDVVIFGEKEYVWNDGKFVLFGDVSAEGERIATLEGEMDSVEGRLDALELIDHSHENADVLNGITAEKVAAWDSAEADAIAHADGLNTAMDTRVKTLEAIDHEAYKAYADQAEADAVATAKEYSDGLNTAMDTRVKVLEAINHEAYKAADEQVLTDAKAYADGLNGAMDARVKVLEAIDHEAYKAADEAVLTSAKAYADGLAVNYDAAGAAATAEANAKSYVDAMFTWGSF